MTIGLLVSLLAEAGLENLTSFSFGYLIDEAVIPRNAEKLTWLLVALGSATLFLTVLVIIADYLWAKLGAFVVNDLRVDLYRHVQGLSLDFFIRRKTGDVLSVFVSDTNSIETCLVTVVPYGVLGICGIILSMSLLISIHPLLASAALVAVSGCFLLPRLIVGRANKAALEMRRQEGRLSSFLQEGLQSQTLIKVFGLEREMAGRFYQETRELVRIEVKSSFLSYITQRIPTMSFFLVSLLILGAAALAAFHGQLTLGNVVSFQMLVMRLGEAIGNLTWLTPIIVEANAGMTRLKEVFNERTRVAEKPDAVRLGPLEDGIVFDNVRFSYPVAGEEASRVAVDGVTLRIPKGQFTVMVGPSGCGKSTLLNLLLRLYDPSSGRVLFDGVDVADAQLESLRSQIGFMSQEAALFDMSLRDNLRMGKLDASDQEILRALEVAEIAGKVSELPDGLNTVLGERGARFSGGERQRLALARALVRQPHILLLDEPTSALDAATEAELLETLGRLIREQGITVVAVTHRLRMAAMADKVVVMREGRVEADGHHTDLLSEQGTYATYWQHSAADSQ
jgi:ATP-binding cassette, subfamily B, bacterial